MDATNKMADNTPRNWQETHTIWHRLTGAADQQVPDADITVQVYDADLDDVVLASAAFDEDGKLYSFLDMYLGEPLPHPTWWADLVFPEDI